MIYNQIVTWTAFAILAMFLITFIKKSLCHILTYDDFPYRSRVMARRVKIDMLTVKQEVKELKLQVFNCSTFQISSFNVSSLLFAIFSGFQGHGFSFFLQFQNICNLYYHSIKTCFENVAGIHFLPTHYQ